MKIRLILLMILCAFVPAIWAQDGNVIPLATERAEKATAVLKQFSAFGADSVPFEILRKAKAVGVFNDVTRFNILFNQGIKAKGVMAARQADGGWSVPVFISLAGSGMRFKIADKKNFDFIFFVMDDKIMEKMRKRGVAPKKLMLGPLVGGKGTDLTLEKASIIYYTFEGGKLSGEEVQGNSFFGDQIFFGLDNNLNKTLYQNRTAQNILLLGKNLTALAPPPPVEEFRQTLNAMLAQSK